MFKSSHLPKLFLTRNTWKYDLKSILRLERIIFRKTNRGTLGVEQGDFTSKNEEDEMKKKEKMEERIKERKRKKER